MNLKLRKLLFFGIAAEALIFLLSYGMYPVIEDAFRFAARYSGRLSLLVFFFAFYLYARDYPKPVGENRQLRNFILLFAVLHLIHWGFLATNIYLNDIPIVVVRVLGGALAYGMIVAAPFALHRVKPELQLIYFYYVSLVMGLTYWARVKGDFEGAETTWFHFAGLGIVILCCGLFGSRIWKSNQASKMTNDK